MARPMQAEAHRPAAVVRPFTSWRPVTMMVPAPRKPMPLMTWAPKRATSVRMPTSAAAEALGGLVARCAAERFSGEFDTVTWVPVSKKRLRQRGYDQARLLAESACRRWDTKPVALLRKVADNPAQSGLTEAAARRANVLGVYEALPEAAGKRVLLIDDICTTGATLTECVRVLKDGGAESVACAAVALTREKKVHKTGKK